MTRPCFNDRLLLGLKGTMSEAELHFIRARLRGGQLSKARRGELPMPLPVGLVTDPAGKVVLDPDAGVQHAIGHLFATFARTGSARAVVQAFNGEGLLFPARVRFGPHKGDLAWMPLKHWRVLRTLHNPRYAGAFVYGRRRERKGPDGKTFHETLPRDQWTALIPDAHPGYITWDTFEHNQTLLEANAQAYGLERSAGPAREGPALLQGLAICGRCGRRMTVRYHQRRGVAVPDYQCVGESIQAGAPRCLTVPGGGIDAAIGQLLLDTVTPLALEVALTVQAELEARADEADALRRSHVERARHHADLARRRYLAVDPDNRLVADSLEADWNDALRQLQTAHDDYERAAAVGERARATSTRSASVPSPPTSPPCGPTPPPRSANANAWPGCSSTTSPWPRPTRSISTSASAAGRPPASPSPSRPPAGRPARPTPTPSPCSTGCSTTTPTPKSPTPSTPPGTAPASTRPSPASSSCTYAAPTTCPATPNASAPAGCSPSTRSPNVSTSTNPPSRTGTTPACSSPTRPTTRTNGSTSRPPPATRGSSNTWASRLANRVLIEPTPGGAV